MITFYKFKLSSIENKTWILLYRSCIEVNIFIKKVDEKMDTVSEKIDKNFADLNLLLTVYERELPDSSKIFGDVHSNIYIKKIEPMVKNKGERSHDVVHACIYCKKLVASIQSHLEHVHKHEESVEMCLSLKIKIDGCRNPETKKGWQQQLHQLQDLLRYKGDNIHNIKVIKQKKGELLIYRRSKDSKFHASNFGPCPSCCMWYPA